MKKIGYIFYAWDYPRFVSTTWKAHIEADLILLDQELINSKPGDERVMIQEHIIFLTQKLKDNV